MILILSQRECSLRPGLHEVIILLKLNMDLQPEQCSDVKQLCLLLVEANYADIWSGGESLGQATDGRTSLLLG